MKIYSFANCALEGMESLAHIWSVHTSVQNMRTEGILRLLSGETIRLHTEDKARLLASAAWKEFCMTHWKPEVIDPETFDILEPFSVDEDDVFLWSPFADTFCSFTSARCLDGTAYPHLFQPVQGEFSSVFRIPLSVCEAHWRELSRRLGHVRRKGLILYPVDHLGPPLHTQEQSQNLLPHVLRFSEAATHILSREGWRIFTPKAELDEEHRQWSHFSVASLRELWNQISREFEISGRNKTALA